MTDRTCRTIQALLVLRAKDLSADEHGRIEAHLATCEPCSDSARLYDEQDRLLKQSAPRVELSAQQRAHLFSQLKRERRWFRMQKTWATVFRSVAGVAAVVALVFILNLAFSRVSDPGLVQPADSGTTTAQPLPTETPSPVPEPIVAPARSEEDLLANSGFEGTSRPIGAVSDQSLVSDGWSPWYDGERAIPEWRVIELPGTDAPADLEARVHSGERAMQWFTTSALHRAGLWQRIEVPENSFVTFAVWVQILSASDEYWVDEQLVSGKEDLGNYTVACGIDPQGLEPTKVQASPPDSVIWSEPVTDADTQAPDGTNRWALCRVSLKARDNRVTAWVMGWNERPLRLTAAFVDDAYLSTMPPRIHTAQAGDTMHTVAQQYRIAVERLCEVNGVPETHELRVGEELVVPVNEYIVEPVTVSTPPPDAIPLSGPLFADQLLLGWELPKTVYKSAEEIQLRLIWQAIRSVDTDWTVFVHLFDANDALVWQEDVTVPRPGQVCDDGHVTSACTTVTEHAVSPPADLPGEYTIRVGLYDRDTMARAPVTGVDSVESSVLVSRVWLAPPDDAPGATNQAFGIEGFALKGPQPVVDAVSDLGLGWLKQEVRWYLVEPAKGEYEWAALDALVEACDAVGIRLLFSVLHTPQWATRFQTNAIEPPADVSDFADFVGAMATRYKGRVHAYEIWREQNMKHNWDEAPLSVEDYVQLLQAAYEAIKSADADAVVVSGGLMPTGVNDGKWAIDNLTYLQQMYDAGLADSCDAVGVLAPGYANPPDVYYREGDLNSGRAFDDHPSFFFRNAVEDTYAVMQANGDGDRLIWITQFGWATVDGMGAKPNPGYTWTVDIDEAQQAEYTATAYAWSRAWGHVGGTFLWNLNAWPELGPDNEMSKYGIVREDWSPRPAYTALKNMPK